MAGTAYRDAQLSLLRAAAEQINSGQLVVAPRVPCPARARSAGRPRPDNKSGAGWTERRQVPWPGHPHLTG